MPSAWHIPDDPREYGSAPVTVPCDRCGRDVRFLEDDLDAMGEDARLCTRCTGEAINETGWVDAIPADTDRPGTR